MVNDDVVKCPLCGGLTHIENPALLEALHSPGLREQIEKFITELLKSPVEELSSVAAAQAGREFQKTSQLESVRADVEAQPEGVDLQSQRTNMKTKRILILGAAGRDFTISTSSFEANPSTTWWDSPPLRFRASPFAAILPS